MGNIIEFAVRKHGIALTPISHAAAEPMCQVAGNPLAERDRRWRKANSYLAYAKALHQVSVYGYCLWSYHGVKECKRYAALRDEAKAVERIGQAEAELLLTPVFRKPDLDLKRRIMAKRGFQYVPINRTELEKVLAADEAYLAIPRKHRANYIGRSG
ncbi:MAG: hypothetical protein PSV22_07680 [Pseudolabrys sp.]|nr:hypothetical protein [Pseudolabrys sp.]